MSNSNFNRGQEVAATRIKNFIASSTDGDFFTLKGWAGTGKTYLTAQIISGLEGERFHIAAPTGKAASVLSGKLDNCEVSTVHRLLYIPNASSTFRLDRLIEEFAAEKDERAKRKIASQIEGERLRLKKNPVSFSNKDKSSIQRGDLVFVDESSMVTQAMADDLLATGARAIFIGDGGQLPPVGGKDFFGHERPDAELEEIVRQAKESPIIDLAHRIRLGEAVTGSDYDSVEEVSIRGKNDVDPQEYVDADQLLAGFNNTRRKLNRFMRKKLGFESRNPQAGERLICLRNNYREKPIRINGVEFKSTGDLQRFEAVEGEEEKAAVYGDRVATLSVEYEGCPIENAEIYVAEFEKNYGDPSEVPELDFSCRGELLEADYAYAITTHKSQGSEWGTVLLADDGFAKRNPSDRKKWLYTAVTRAKENIKIVKA